MKKLLSPPTTPVFFVSLAIAIVAALVNQGIISGIQVAPVWIMGIAYALLAGACLMRRV